MLCEKLIISALQIPAFSEGNRMVQVMARGVQELIRSTFLVQCGFVDLEEFGFGNS